LLSIGHPIYAVAVCGRLFCFEHLCVSIFTSEEISAHVALHRAASSHDLPTMHCGLGD